MGMPARLWVSLDTGPDRRKPLDNFKFMDSWPAWVRWLLVLVAANGLPLFWLFVSRVFGDGWTSLIACLFLASASTIWCSVAIAPGSKLGVALGLGSIALIFAYSGYLEDVRAANTPNMLNLDPTHNISCALVGGVIVAWGLVVWGYLGRRQARLPSR